MTDEMREKIRLAQLEKLKALPYVVVGSPVEMPLPSPPTTPPQVQAVPPQPPPKKGCGCGGNRKATHLANQQQAIRNKLYAARKN